MQKSIFLKLITLLIVLTFVLPNSSLAAQIVSRRGKIVQKDPTSLVMESYEDISFWQALFKLFQYGKVKYVVFNKSLTEVKKTTGGVFNHKEEKISFDDLKIGETIDVVGELQKIALKNENGEISANSITLFQSAKDIKELGIAPINITTTTEAETTNSNNVSIPWVKGTNSPSVVTKPTVYKSTECADEGEPILKLGLIAGKIPTECCMGLKLCSLSVNDNVNNTLDYKGYAAIVVGYCKKECPAVDNTSDLLPGNTTGKSLWQTIKDLFTIKTMRECYKDSECMNKYCRYTDNQLNTISCDYRCNTEGKCVRGNAINKVQCVNSSDCSLDMNGSCVLNNSNINLGTSGTCSCVEGKCQSGSGETTSTTTRNPINMVCVRNVECSWCNFNCLTNSEKDNFKDMGITCDSKAKPGFSCSCLGNKCQSLPETTVPTIEQPDKPTLPTLPGLITTTTIKKVTTTTVWKPTTVTTLPGDCIQPKCGDGLCHVWEKYADSVKGTCYCLLNSGSFKTEAYVNSVGHIVCDNGGLNRNYCPNDCNGTNIPEPTTTTTTWIAPPPINVPIIPPVVTPTTIPITTTTLKAISGSGYPTSILLNGFCGLQTNSSCKVDSDCKVSGCSGEICQAVVDKKYVSTCQWNSCYAKPSNVYCGCNNSKCQWYGASSSLTPSTTIFPTTTTKPITSPITIPTAPVISSPGAIVSPGTCYYLQVMSCIDGIVHNAESSCDGIATNKCHDFIVTDPINSKCQCR